MWRGNILTPSFLVGMRQHAALPAGKCASSAGMRSCPAESGACAAVHGVDSIGALV